MSATETPSLASEYAILTERCGLLDRSERGKLALTGAGAKEFLNGQVTNDVERLAEGEGCYAAFLTHKGKMLGDLRILDAGSDLLLDTERVALQALFDMIGRFKIGFDVALHKRTLECALLSLIGPQADEVAARAIDGEMTLAAQEHSHAPARIGGFFVRLIRTDTGIDALCEFHGADAVRTALGQAGAEPVSEQAAEVVRVERGRPRYGVDLDETTIPQEAGLNERAVSFTKGCYVGQETVARLYYKGKPNRLLRGLVLSEPLQVGSDTAQAGANRLQAGTRLILGERVVGQLTSAVLSPRFGPIGLGLVRVTAEPGATLAVADSDASAVVRELPFA